MKRALTRGKPRQHERIGQKALVEFHGRVVFSPLDAILFAIPNGEKRDAATAHALSGGKRQAPPKELIAAIKLALGSDSLTLPPILEIHAARIVTAAGLGVLPGVADLELLIQGGATFVETKLAKTLDHRKTGQSDEQLVFEWAVRRLGHDYRVIRTVDEYEALLREKGVRLRISERKVVFRPVENPAAPS